MRSNTRKSTAVNKRHRSQRTNAVNGAVSVSGDATNAKLIPWGNDDKLPDKILEAVMDSGAATACWEKIDAFIQADGFSNETAAGFMVNPKQSADALASDIAPDYSLFSGFALRVKYNLALQPAEVYHVPIRHVRKRDDGKFVVNHTRGTKAFKKIHDEILDAFDNSPDAVSAMLNRVRDGAETMPDGSIKYHQPGQLLFVYRRTACSTEYPVPAFWTLSGAKNIYADTEIAITDLENLENNFTPPVIFHFEGNVDSVKQDANGKTEYDYLVDDVTDLTDKENRSQAVVLTGNYKPNLIAWDNTKAVLALDTKREVIGRAVCRDFGVPPILCGYYTAGALAQSREILNAIQLFQNDIYPRQNQITRVFEMLFPNADEKFWYLTTLSPLDVIPVELLPFMNDEQKQKLIERFTSS